MVSGEAEATKSNNRVKSQSDRKICQINNCYLVVFISRDFQVCLGWGSNGEQRVALETGAKILVQYVRQPTVYIVFAGIPKALLHPLK